MDLKDITSALVELNDEKVKVLVRDALSSGIEPETVLKQGLIPGITEVGRLFSCKEYFVPEVLVAAETFYAGFDILKPALKKDPFPDRGKIMICVVEGDIHDIGKNIVKVLTEAAGFGVIDLGKDVQTAALMDAVFKEKPRILCLSALMTTTMTTMETVIRQIKKRNPDWRLQIIIGGAPVSADYAARIGADGYAPDAGTAVALIDRLTHEK